jgi:hemolysin III
VSDGTLKARFRGTSHQLGALAALVVGAVVLAQAPSPRAALAGIIYVLALVAQFTISAIFHRGDWGPVAYERMRRLDHGCIYVLIAGSYTPFCMLALDAHLARTLLAIAWIGAAIGMTIAVFWVNKPRWVVAVGYVALGWAVLPFIPQVAASIGASRSWTMLAGGVLYSIGAAVYVTKRPDPSPALFGYHEVFHALVVLASVCMFTVVSSLVLGA